MKVARTLIPGTEFRTPLGPVGNPAKGALSEEGYRRYRLLESLGVIAIEVDRDYESLRAECARNPSCLLGKPPSLTNDWRDNVLHRLIATKTPKGDSLMSKLQREEADTAKKNGWLYIPVGSFRITKIVENVPYQAQGSRWRMVSILYDATWEPIYKEYQSRIGESLANKRKGRVLLQYDPFKPTWDLRTGDYANADSDFPTEHVPQAVAQFERK
jgi:hypothetical protein